MTLKASYFRDMALSFFNLVDFKKPAQNMAKCVVEKFITFLCSTNDFQSLNTDQKQTVITRNLCLAASLIVITAHWIEDGQDQLIFFRKLLTSFSAADVLLDYVRPEKLTIKKIHQKTPNLYNSEELEQIDRIMLDLQKLDFLTISDLEKLTIAVLFHTEPNDTMPSIECYRNFLLRSLENDMKSDSDRLYHQILNYCVTFSMIQDFETSVMKELFDYSI